MQRNDPERDEEEWRSIVENFGDRVELEDEPAPPAAPPSYRLDPVVSPADDQDDTEDPDRFVPPDPPLPPRPSRDRLAAWIGLFGVPALVLVLMLLGIQVRGWFAWALVAGFIAGFGYLVFHLPRTPDDPFDDGARL